MITYSLQNLLLDDPELDHESFLGPVVRMRWMSNLLRLAVLDEADRLRAAAGEYTEHDAEIRRLRRSSMAPDAGRYYLVEGKANQVFKELDVEQARQILELWRGRQPLPGLATKSDDLAYDDPEERFHEVQVEEEIPVEEHDGDHEELTDEPEANHRHEPLPGPHASVSHSPRAATLNTKHQTQNTQHQTRPARLARFAATAAITLLAAWLVMAATWFIKAYIQTTAPPPDLSAVEGPADITSTTKIVPSAVPKTPRHQTRNTNSHA